MSNLKKVLMKCGTRLSYENRWLVVDECTGFYEVYQHEYRRLTVTLMVTDDEDEAVKILLGEK